MGFNAFNHSGANAFIHSGYNARGGDSTPATTAYMCFDPITGLVKWVLRKSTLDALFKDADIAGNAYLTTNDGQSLTRIGLDGVQDFFIPFPSTSATAVTGSADGAISAGKAISSTGVISGPANVYVSANCDEIGAGYSAGSFFPNNIPARKSVVNGNYALTWQNAASTNNGPYTGTNIGQKICFFDGRLIKLDRANGAETVTPALAGAQINPTPPMCVDTSGNVWIRFRKYSPAGVFMLDIANKLYLGASPFVVLTDRIGNTFVSTVSTSLAKIDGNGNAVWVVDVPKGAYFNKDLDRTFLFADQNGGLYGQIQVANGIPNYTSPIHIDQNGQQDKTYLFNGTLLTQRAGHLFAAITLQDGDPDPVLVL